MKSLIYIFFCYSALSFGCKKKTETLPETLLGNWQTKLETWHTVYPEQTRSSKNYDVSKDFFSFYKLEINDKRLKMIDSDGDYAYANYTTEYDDVTKSNYIKIADGSDTKYEYILVNNHLTIKIYSLGARDNIGPYYSYKEIKLTK